MSWTGIFDFTEDPDIRQEIDTFLGEKKGRPIVSRYERQHGGGVHWTVNLGGARVVDSWNKHFQPPEFYSTVDTNCSLFALFAALQYTYNWTNELIAYDPAYNYRQLGLMLTFLGRQKWFYAILRKLALQRRFLGKWDKYGWTIAQFKTQFKLDVRNWKRQWVR